MQTSRTSGWKRAPICFISANQAVSPVWYSVGPPLIWMTKPTGGPAKRMGPLSLAWNPELCTASTRATLTSSFSLRMPPILPSVSNPVASFGTPAAASCAPSSLFKGLLIHGSIASVVPPGVFTTNAACPYQVTSVLPLPPACAKAGRAASARSAKIFMSVPFVRAPVGPGIYRVHKPVGHTSFSLVQGLMDEVQAAGIRRDRLPVCHGGALDPFAEGLVLLLAGQATRLMELLHPVPKTYVAAIAWGAETDNVDPLGRIVARADPSRLSAEALEQALTPFLGWREQVPPNTSNKRVDGERAYRKAHRGESFELPPSRVYLHEARFISHRLPVSSTLRLVTGGGYYVRSLVRDLGRATGALAHLAALRRTAIGPWEDPPPGPRVWMRGAELFPWCASVSVSAPELSALRGGKRLPSRPLTAPEWSLPSGFPDPQAPVRGLLDGDLVALLRERDGELWPERLLGAPRRARRPARRR